MCLSVPILIVVKWILVLVLRINSAGTNIAYLLVLNKVFHFTFLSCVYSVMFVYKCSAFWLSKVKKVEVSLVSAKVKP